MREAELKSWRAGSTLREVTKWDANPDSWSLPRDTREMKEVSQSEMRMCTVHSRREKVD